MHIATSRSFATETRLEEPCDRCGGTNTYASMLDFYYCADCRQAPQQCPKCNVFKAFGERSDGERRLKCYSCNRLMRRWGFGYTDLKRLV